MPSATITSKGQVTIPKKVRDQLQLKSGDTINFEIDSANSARITSTKRSPSEAYGILFREDQKAYTVEEMDKGITEYLRKKIQEKVIAADTNILVRFLVRDLEEQAQKVKMLVGSGTSFYINAVVISELSWVIQKIYGYTKEEFVWAIDFLFETEGFIFFDQEIVKKSLSDYLNQSADFSDCLINQINLNEGLETITLDKKASRLSGMELLK